MNLISSRGKIQKAVTPKDHSFFQRAREAYITTMSQLEGAFHISFAA